MKPLYAKVSTETSGQDAQEFHALYAQYERMVRAVLFNLAGSGSLDDLAQETFLRVWKGRENFRGESSMKTWIYRVAVNAASDHFRRAKRWRFSPLKDTLPAPGNHEQSSIEKDLVQRGLLTLSEEHRVVLVLSAMEGLSSAEISKILDVAEGTVRSRLHYAKEKLVEFLKSQGVVL